VSRAPAANGRDELTRCGTYDARKTYEQLDIVAQDDAAFIAAPRRSRFCAAVTQ
jgi:hypothetical protein